MAAQPTMVIPSLPWSFVQGPPITEYCNQRRLNIRQRLQLLRQVCEAVEHAHRRGIIHRDLKPSNVLVPEIDGRAVPKVIDFGIAKALGEKLSDATIYTHFSQLLGTPAYMSPEQAGLGVVDVDTRSDVYSLGVLLYELLTGNTPFDRETLQRAGYDEMRRIIREDQPRRPSTSVSTLTAEACTTAAQERSSDPQHLGVTLRGELDCVVMKALEKDREQRYESAKALEADIDRYLNNEIVAARPPSNWYRVRKFTQRNRALVASVTGVFIALSLGATVATVGFVKAESRLAEVTREQENNRVLIQLLSDMYPKPWGMKMLGRNHTVYDSIEEISPTLEERLRNHPTVEIEVRRIFADAYRAAVEFDKARPHWNRALELAIEQKQYRTVAFIHAFLADEVGWNHYEPLDYAELLQHAERAIEICASLQIEPDWLKVAWFSKSRCQLMISPAHKAEAEEAMRMCLRIAEMDGTQDSLVRWNLGLVLMHLGDHRLDDAETEFRIALDSSGTTMRKVTALEALGRCLCRKGDISGAIDHFEQAWELCHADDDLQHEPRTFKIGVRLVKTLFADGQVRAAFDQLSQIQDKLTGELAPPESLLECQILEGWLYHQLENYPAAREAFYESETIASRNMPETHEMVACSHTFLGMTLEALGRDEEAAASFQKAIPIAQPFVDTPFVGAQPYWMYGRSILGSAGDTQELNKALDTGRRGIDFLGGWPRTWLLPAFHHVIAGVQIRLGDRQGAVNSLKEGLEKAEEPQATWRAYEEPPTTRRDLEVMLAELYLMNPDEARNAIDVYREGVNQRMKLKDDDHIQVALAQLRLGEVFVRLGDSRAAEQPLKDAYKKLEPHSDVVNHLRSRAAAGLVKVYQALGMPDSEAEWRSKAETLDAAIEHNE